MQVRKLLVALYKAGKMSAEELNVEPGIIVCQDIISSKRQIDTVDLPSFLEGVTKVTETMFSSPELEAEMSQVNRKQKRETQKSTFDKLQALASVKIIELDQFMQVECDIHYKEFVEKVKGVELSRFL